MVKRLGMEPNRLGLNFSSAAYLTSLSLSLPICKIRIKPHPSSTVGVRIKSGNRC